MSLFGLLLRQIQRLCHIINVVRYPLWRALNRTGSLHNIYTDPNQHTVRPKKRTQEEDKVGKGWLEREEDVDVKGMNVIACILGSICDGWCAWRD